MWKMPEEVILARADNELPTVSKEKNELLESKERNYKEPSVKSDKMS